MQRVEGHDLSGDAVSEIAHACWREQGTWGPHEAGWGETQAGSLCVSVSLGADSVHWGQYWGNVGIWRDQVYGTGVLGYVV